MAAPMATSSYRLWICGRRPCKCTDLLLKMSSECKGIVVGKKEGKSKSGRIQEQESKVGIDLRCARRSRKVKIGTDPRKGGTAVDWTDSRDYDSSRRMGEKNIKMALLLRVIFSFGLLDARPSRVPVGHA
ncbi:hypothetical protein CRG98_022482 [Punica granatum]|uniref:Uncharacterized protein n=1 Tax=Punica granatum TaxID=22663 RepID=A0A2I0JLM9_PUNGR|nr:hypothetical protein CRG98_022482 [Punica granatum]